MKKIVLIVIPLIYTILVSLCGCIEERSIPKIFPVEKYLEAKMIPFDYIIDRANVMIVNDCIVFESNKVDTLIHIYSLPEIDHILSFGTKGQGPNEFLLLDIVNNNSDLLCLSGYVNTDLIKCFRIDENNKTVINTKEYHLKGISVHKIINPVIINDSILFYFEHSAAMHIVSYDLKKEKIISQKKIKVNEKHNKIWQRYNNGFIKVNSQTVAFAYLYQDKISFMNHNFSGINTVKKDAKTSIEEVVQNSIIYYLNGYAGKDKFYYLYLGCSLKELDNGEKQNSIEVFDNKGNPLVKYNLNVPIYRFAVDEKNYMMYAYGENDDVLLVFNLNE